MRPNLEVLSSALTHRVLLQGNRAVGGTGPGAAAAVRRPRGDPQRRQHQLAATLDALRHRPGGGAGTPRHRPAPRTARRGPEPAGPPGRGADVPQRRPAGLRPPRAGSGALRSPWQYLAGRRGPLTSNTVEAGGFLRLDPSAPTPELGLIVAPALKNQPQRLIPFGHGISLHVAVMHPQSRGALNSADPRDRPHLAANFLSHPDDLRKLVDGVRLRRLADTAAFRRHLGRTGPGPRHRQPGADRAMGPPQPRHGVPPRRHLQDGPRPARRGRRPARARHRRPARGRRLDHADPDHRQHQRPGDDDRGEGGGDDPAQRNMPRRSPMPPSSPR